MFYFNCNSLSRIFNIIIVSWIGKYQWLENLFNHVYDLTDFWIVIVKSDITGL